MQSFSHCLLLSTGGRSSRRSIQQQTLDSVLLCHCVKRRWPLILLLKLNIYCQTTMNILMLHIQHFEICEDKDCFALGRALSFSHKKLKKCLNNEKSIKNEQIEFYGTKAVLN